MIVIRGAEVYDPAHVVSGSVQDVWVDGDKIVSPPPNPENIEVIDARGCMVAPAGVEIHTHVAGAGLNAARRMMLGDSARLDMLAPPANIAARRYLSLGYTTVFDAASSPLLARQTYQDMQQMGGVDRGTFTQLGDHRLLLKVLAEGNMGEIRDTLAWLLEVAGGYAVKLVNLGGGVAWKAGMPAPGLDQPVGLGNLTQRKIIQTIVGAVNELGLPHPIHLHAGRLGQPGNAPSFCETTRALEGQRAHLCHIQFYSYGQDSHDGYASGAEQVIRCLQDYPQVTCDVGQVVFGPAMAVTFDTGGLYTLQRSTRQPWMSRQLEGEGGTNVMPLAYQIDQAASAVQWAVGLDLLLTNQDPTRLFLTTDHPNGAPFTAYPQVIEWLMSSQARREVLKQSHKAASQKTGLASIEREYTMNEVVAMTSWGPAKALGLTDRGHLAPGALADLRCHRKGANIQEMFACPSWVMHRGKIVVREGRVLDVSGGDLLVVRPEWDKGRLTHLHKRLAEIVSVPPEDYGLGKTALFGAAEVPCISTAS